MREARPQRAASGAPVASTGMSDPLQREATDVLQRLLRFKTVNPPGDEQACQEYLAEYLAAAGLECELLAEVEGRPNLIATLAGHEPGPVLGYLGHVDTVLATAQEWRHDPWSGDLLDGVLWGRGAIDMKSQVAAEAVAAAALARRGWRPARGALKVFAVVDEETGGRHGAQFLTREHPDLVRCDLLLNEGGGTVFEHGGRRWWTVCCAEKGVFRFTITTHGVAGHASYPRMGDNALLKMAPLIDRLAPGTPSSDLTAEPRAFLEALGEPAGGDAEAALERLAAEDPALSGLVEPMFGVTMTPTRIRASEKINVIPSRAHMQVDCRVPAGLGEPEARRRVEELLGANGYDLEFQETVEGNRSPLSSPLMDAIAGWLREQDAEAGVVPITLPGFSDSRWWRDAFPETVAYGFFPHLHMPWSETSPLVHSNDERIDVRDLAFATRFFHDLAPRVLG